MRQGRLAVVRGSRASWAACGIAAAGLFSACLVTSKVDYDEPFIPSEVSRADPRPGEFASVPPEPEEDCLEEDGYMRFAIHVSDMNREERLQLQIVVNREYSRGDDIPPTGERARKDVSFCVPKDELSQRCNLVEALVSSEFPRKTSRPYDTANGDLSSVHWWVIGEAEDNPSASYLDCPQDVRDAGSL